MAGGGDDDLPGLDAASLARAEAALAGLSEDYLRWAEADATALAACLADLAAAPDRSAECMARLFRVAHDMKGQAGTFGYPLVTTVAARLCRLVAATSHPDGPALDHITAHVEALAAIIADRLAGDGGEAGRAILRRLRGGPSAI